MGHSSLSTTDDEKVAVLQTEYPIAIPVSGLADESKSPGHACEREEAMTTYERFRHRNREVIAECFGTMILVAFSDGISSRVLLSKSGGLTDISSSAASALMLGYMVSGGVSGGHMNPAVTLASAVYRGFPKRKVIPYMLAQLLGGFIGSLLVYGIYIQSINNFEGGDGIRTVFGENATASVFSTFPQPYLSTRGQFTSELTCTAFLQIGIFALTDPYNAPAGDLFPLALWVLMYAVGSCFGFQTGFALNIARDLAPRVAAVAVGYGSEMFTAYDAYAWVPVVASLVGSLVGGGLYDLCIYRGKDSPVNQRNFGFSRQMLCFSKKAPTRV